MPENDEFESFEAAGIILPIQISLPSTTLESGINIPPLINVAPGKFGKKNKRSPIYTLYLYYLNRLYDVRNKAVAPRKKSKS